MDLTATAPNLSTKLVWLAGTLGLAGWLTLVLGTIHILTQQSPGGDYSWEPNALDFSILVLALASVACLSLAWRTKKAHCLGLVHIAPLASALSYPSFLLCYGAWEVIS
jgi:hypothetical protein